MPKTYNQQATTLIQEGLKTLTTNPVQVPEFSKRLQQIAHRRDMHIVSKGGWSFFDFSDRLLRRLKTLAEKGVVVLNKPDGARSYVVSLPKN